MFERTRGRVATAAVVTAALATVLGGAAPSVLAKTGKPLSRGALAAKGDDICYAHSKTIATKFEKMAKKARNRPSEAQLVAFVRSTVVPEIRASFDELAKLEPRPADAAAFRDALATGRRELAAVQGDPSLTFGSKNPFAGAEKKFKALGFERCAQP